MTNLLCFAYQDYDIKSLSSDYGSCWSDFIEQLSRTGDYVFKRVRLPHVPYETAVYTILSTCEIASNMARYDGIKYGRDLRRDNCIFLSLYFSSGHHTKNIDLKIDTYEDILRKTRDESLGERVRGRILAGNYFLLEE